MRQSNSVSVGSAPRAEVETAETSRVDGVVLCSA